MKNINQVFFEISPNSQTQICQITNKGRKLLLEISAYNDLLLRSKNGCKMSDKPINLIIIRTKDALTGEIIFHQELFLATCGEKKNQLSPQKVLLEYQERYGIESQRRTVVF